MSKNESKDFRPPVGEQESVNKMTDKEKLRVVTGRQGRLNADYYLGLPEYKGHTLFYRHDNDGSIDMALDVGAQLVPKRKSHSPRYKGVNDRGTSEYACVPGVMMDQGHPVTAYLLAMPDEEYEKYFINPVKQRNQDIQNAMGLGKISPEDQEIGGGLKTYAGKIGEEEHQSNLIR